MSWMIYSKHRADAAAGSYDAESARVKFMAMLGVLSNALFFVVLIAASIPPFMIDPCWD